MTARGQLSRMAIFITAMLFAGSICAEPIVTQSSIDSTSRNYNYNYNTSTSDSTSYSRSDSNSKSTSDSNSNSTSNSTTTVKSPPPTAIAQIGRAHV